MKKFLSVVLSILLTIGMFWSVPFTESPFKITAEAASSGTCGSNLTWTLDNSGVLTISGTGAMTSYSSSSAPWYSSSSSVKAVVINEGVTSIGSGAFWCCESLTSITIPDSVTSIGEYSFYNCESLTSITIPGSVTSIDSYAFKYCENLASIKIPDSVTSISNYAFEGCTSLTSITIPNSVTSIGEYAFSGCTELTSITIPDSVTSIGNYAFSYCESLTSITIPNSVTNISEFSFGGCISLKAINVSSNNKCYTSVDGVLFNKDKTELIQYPAEKGITKYTIPGSVTSIGESAFYYCQSLTSITIPDSVTSIGSGAFWGCLNLSSITIPDSVTSIGIDIFGDTMLYNNWVNSLSNVLYVNNHLIDVKNTWSGSFKIKDGTKTIASSALCWCESLTEITIPDSVTSIGDCAFRGCTSLTSITIPNSVTSIGDDAFSDCTSLTSITIPDSITSIGEGAFENCKSLTSITIPSSVTSIGNYAFKGCTSLTAIKIPNSITSIGEGAFENCTSLTSITIPGSVTSISNYAFEGCTSLTSVTIRDSITSIGKGAFEKCTSLTSITIPDSVTSIGDDAFYYCSSLTAITIPNSVTSVGNWVFSYCKSLTAITIPGSVTSIGNYAFYDCTSLTSTTIPDSVTSIGEYAFSGCTGLTSITIPDSVTSIGDFAFRSCTSLTAINVSSSNQYYTSVGGVVFNKDKTELIQYPAGKGITTYTVPDSVINIENGAFYNCDNIMSIILPGSVTSIGGSAFCNCNNITSILIPDSVTSIGSSAFYDCTSLTSITIPDSVTTIGNSAFYNCTSLTSVTIGNSVTSIGNSAFYNCKSLTSITIPECVTSIDNRAFYNCNNISTVCYEGNQTLWQFITIGSNNERLTSATIIYNCLSTRTTKLAKIITSGESKSFYFKPQETGKYVFYSTGSTDTKAYLYDSHGNQLEYNDDGGESNNFRIEYTLTAGEVYEYQVKYYSSSKTGTISCEFSRIYTITYDANGGSGAPVSQTKEDAAEITLSTETPLRQCGIFMGWSTDPGSTEVQYASGATYSLPADVTFYAVWSEVHAPVGMFVPEWYLESEATCTTEGKEYTVCRNCGIKSYKNIPALGHNYSSDYTVDLESGCTTEGSKSRHCTRCTSTIDIFTIPATGHSYSDWVIDRLATYTTSGERHKTCSNCDDVVTDSNVDYAMAVASFIANGGKCGESSRTLIIEEPFGDLPTASKSNYIFKGWTLTNGGTDYVTKTDYITEDTNLYASWELVVPKSVSISNMPLKTGYTVGDTIETRGLKLLVTYNDDSTKTVASGFTTSYDFSSSGNKTVNVAYTENNVTVNTSYTVYVHEPARLYSDTIEANAGETVDVPVYIENNPGIAGFTIYMEYDETVFTPVCVNGDDISGYGMLDDNIGYTSENQVQVTWSGTENYYEDGELFNITFEIAEDSTVRGDYDFAISYKQPDTFDELTNDVVLECEKSTVTVINEQKEPVEIGGDFIEAVAGRNVDVAVSVLNNDNLTGTELTVNYNSDIFTFVKVKYGLATITADGSVDGEVTINLEDVSQESEGILFTITFGVKEYASGTEYFTITSSDSEVIVNDIEVDITNPMADKPAIIYSDKITGDVGDTVLVPVYIKNNHGMYSFKITVTYDSNLLTPVSYCKAETNISSCGPVSNNISANMKKGRNYFDIIFYGDEEFCENGKIFTLKFTLNETAPMNTSLQIDYSQDDTCTIIDGVETEVVLDCNSVDFEIGGAFIEENVMYLSPRNSVSTTDLLLWFPSVTGSHIENISTIYGNFYGTGSTFDYIAHGVTTAYTVVVKGDADGDSVIDVLDVMHVERASNQNEDLSESQTLASDLNNDGEITIEDFSAMVNLALR